MATEIERKFLVRGDGWRPGAAVVPVRQGYLSLDPQRTVRVRVAGDAAFLTVKGEARGASRAEYEYPIPRVDAEAMLATLCLQPLIEKTRYRVPHAGHVWEVDVFDGANRGLIVAEVELADEAEAPVLPDWVGAEVTGDPRYVNARLVERPFAAWAQDGAAGAARGLRAAGLSPPPRSSG